MNTKDVVEEVPEVDDMLEEIFERQALLKREYDAIERSNGFHVPNEHPVDLHNRFRQHFLKDFTWRVVEELGEAMNCLKNKPWKMTHMLTDEDHYKEELADTFHFFIELCINSGIDAKELFTLYFKKSKVNEFRVRSKY